MARWDSGLPKLALGFYMGAAPTVTLSLGSSVPTSALATSASGAEVSTAADLWIPVAVGFAVPTAPVKFMSIVPWIEVAVGPSVNLNESVKPESVLGMMVNVPSPTTNVVAGIDLRGGLKIDFHLGRAIDLGASLMFANFGSGLSGPFAAFVGGSLTYHWDDVVSGILTPKERLSHEDCVDVEERMQDCPVTKKPAVSTRPLAPAPAPTPAPRPAVYTQVPTPSPAAATPPPAWPAVPSSSAAVPSSPTPAPSSPAPAAAPPKPATP